jgi:hypothetical protein
MGLLMSRSKGCDRLAMTRACALLNMRVLLTGKMDWMDRSCLGGISGEVCLMYSWGLTHPMKEVVIIRKNNEDDCIKAVGLGELEG